MPPLRFGALPFLLLIGAAPAGAQTIGIFAANPTLSTPSSVAVDGAGNVFVASFIGTGGGPPAIVKITPAGATTTVFTGTSDDPISAIALDTGGNLYIADIAANQVLRQTQGGQISVFVPQSAGLALPAGLAFDGAGNLYVSNQGTNAILKVTPAGAVTTFVDGTSNLGRPAGLAFDALGNLFVANAGTPFFGPPLSEGGNRAFSISKITPSGVVNDFTPPNYPFTTDVDFDPAELIIDAQGNLFVSVIAGNLTDGATPLYEVTAAGSISRFDTTHFLRAAGLGLDPNAKIVVADAAAGTVSRLAESGAVAAPIFANGFAGTVAAAFDGNGNLYIANKELATISKVTPAGAVSTFVPATAGLVNPQALAFDGQGNLFVANSGPSTDGTSAATISKVTPAGTVSTFLGTGNGLDFPQGLAFDAAGNLYIANTGVPSSTILKVTPGGQISTFVSQAAMLVAENMVFDSGGNLYVAAIDRIAKVTPDGGVSTFATLPGTFLLPQPLAIDSAGNLYTAIGINDPDSMVGILKVTPSGTVSVVAQTTIGASTPQMAAPSGLAFDRSGLLYAVDPGSNSILKIIFTPPPLVASILPGSRSVEAGPTATATVFATMINLTGSTLGACGVEMPVTALGTMNFQTTNPATNALIGTLNKPVSIPPNGVQTYLLAFPATFAHTELGLAPIFFCQDVSPAAIIPGVDTVDLTFANGPIADIIALSATATNDGTVHLNNEIGAFAVATIDAGAGASLTATADTGGVSLPVSISLCQTNAGGQCLAPPAASVPITYAANATPTFSVFATATAPIPFAPGASRIFVRFLDSDEVSHGATSVAVTTN